jgi:hypothetical protein
LTTADTGVAREFYDRLFGREPDVAPFEDFQEYELHPGSWFQITTQLESGRVRRVRFGDPIGLFQDLQVHPHLG